MSRPLPPLGWLRSFEASARHLSFTSAAEELGLTQSAISQQVKALETRLGFPLFRRHARGLALTDNGRRLLPEVEAPLQALSTAMTGVLTWPEKGLLTIASSVSVAQWVIAPRLEDFRARFRGQKIRVLSAIWPDDFHTIRADVEIRFGSARQAGAGAKPLLPNRLIALKAPGLEGSLQDLPLIEAVGTSGGWQAWAKMVEDVPPPALYADTFGMAMQFAVHGNGVALVSEVLAEYALKSGQLVQAHHGSIPSQEGYYCSADTTKPEAAAARDWILGDFSDN